MRNVPTFHVACIKKLGRTVYVAPGNGDGTFQPQSAVATGFDHPYATAVADLNRDGSLDLAIANTSNVNCAGSSVAAYLQRGTGFGLVPNEAGNREPAKFNASWFQTASTPAFSECVVAFQTHRSPFNLAASIPGMSATR